MGYRRFAFFCLGGALTLGLAGLIAWEMKFYLLGSFNSRFVPMAPATALQILLLSGILFFALLRPRSRPVFFSVAGVGAVVFFVALSHLLHFSLGLPLNLEAVFASPGTMGDIPVGRMSPITSANFLFLSVCCLLLSWERLSRSRHLVTASLPACIVILSNFVILLGYIYGTPFLYGGGRVIPMAFPSAIACLLLAVVVVFAEGPEQSPLCYFVGDSAGALLLRSFLPINLLAVLLAGLLYNLFPEIWRLNPAFIAAMIALAIVGVTTLLVSHSARVIGTEIDGKEEALRIKTAELERSNKDLEQFAYVASHDLQEPLRKILTFSDILVTDYAEILGDRGRDCLDRMKSSTLRMRELIKGLLKYSRLSTQESLPEEVNLQNLVRDVVGDLEDRVVRSQGVVEVGDLPSVVADSSQMRQLFQNLIGNALKFYESGKNPHVTIRRGGEDNGLVEIVVEDQGVGFDQKFADRIFQPFQRLHTRDEYEGTGMGLAICEKIVRRHGGTITVKAASGKGAIFTVTLPASSQIPRRA